MKLHELQRNKQKEPIHQLFPEEYNRRTHFELKTFEKIYAFVLK